MKEIWKSVVGFEGSYEVNNLNQVKSLDRWIKLKDGRIRLQKGKILKPKIIDKNGYQQVCLSKNGVSKMFLVHRLVAEAFISNPDNLPCINHKDENPQIILQIILNGVTINTITIMVLLIEEGLKNSLHQFSNMTYKVIS